jgi:lipoate-protein ligase A
VATDHALTLVWDDRTPRDAAGQMALDEAALALATEGVHLLRLYRWSADTVSLGANEAATRHWDRTALAHHGIPCVRRPTGGRAVWHATDDLTYAWTGPVASLGGVGAAYTTLHQRLAAALEDALALGPTLAPRPDRLPGLAPGACFDVPVGGEVLIAGRKAIGSAQLVRHGMLLQHGAIARTDRGAALGRYRIAPSTTPLAHADPLPTADVLGAAIIAGWLGAGARLAAPELTSRLDATSLQWLPRYHDPAWTWRR